MKQPFLRDYQEEAVKNMRNGCILNGGVGSGKSRTGLYYYFKEQGGYIDSNYHPMKNPRDLYIITTARKRDTLEWECELVPYHLSPHEDVNGYSNKVVIDSWNNIRKYEKVVGAFFIFDEDRIVGSGAWVKAFLQIAKKNHWIVLSATPGDTWIEYWAIFVANGFYKNKTDFTNQHAVWARYTSFPKIDRYVNTKVLEKYKHDILVEMHFDRETIQHHETVRCNYDKETYKMLFKDRWDPYENLPIDSASQLCYLARKVVNSDSSRSVALLELLDDHPKVIIFYNYNYELDILRNLGYIPGTIIHEWNGQKHELIPEGDRWVYLVQYNAGCEGWNCIVTDTIIFYSQTYSYKVYTQACGRIDRLNTPFRDLYYYDFKSNASIDLAIGKALAEKKKFNEKKWVGW